MTKLQSNQNLEITEMDYLLACNYVFTGFSRQGLLMILFVLYALFHYGLFAELLSSLCNIWAAKPKRLDRIKNPLAM